MADPRYGGQDYLRRADLREEGLLLRRTKGSSSELTRWSDLLREAARPLMCSIGTS